MTKGFNKLLLEINDKSMSEQVEILNHTFNKWKGSEEQTNDIIILGIKI